MNQSRKYCNYFSGWNLLASKVLRGYIPAMKETPKKLLTSQDVLSLMKYPGTNRSPNEKTLYNYVQKLKALGKFGDGPKLIKIGPGRGVNHFTPEQAALLVAEFESLNWRKFQAAKKSN